MKFYAFCLAYLYLIKNKNKHTTNSLFHRTINRKWKFQNSCNVFIHCKTATGYVLHLFLCSISKNCNNYFQICIDY